MIKLSDEAPQDFDAVEALYDRCFSPDRNKLSSYRLREGVARIDPLCRLAWDTEGQLRGAIRYWPVRVGGYDAVLLGPIAVDKTVQGAGFGVALIEDTLPRAAAMGIERVILVGDLDYFGRFGFQRLAAVEMPPPTDPLRVLGHELVADAWDGVSGPVTRAV